MKPAKVVDHITQWLRQYSRNAGTHGFVAGISGGIDSAVTSTLCAHSSLPVLCLELPIHQNADQNSRARQHAAWLENNFENVSSKTVSLTRVFDAFIDSLPAAPGAARQMALVNARARLRMTTLYYFAGLHGYLVAGTGNKVEDFGVGFYTKYGDGGVDLSPVADLMKTEVYQIGAHLGVNPEILDAHPTDGLWDDNRTDEDQIGASYPELEWAMNYQGTQDSDSLSDRQRKILEIYNRLHRANMHKMEPIPVCQIPWELKK